MLHLVTKDRFEKNCLGKLPNKKIELDLELSWPYYETESSWILYIKELNIGLVFGEFNESSTKVSFDDWKITQISEKPDPRYTLNIMKACNYLDFEFYTICGPGIWRIENTRTGETKEFSIKLSGNSYYKTTAIGYSEKLKIPMCKTEIKIIDNFIQSVCYGIRGNYI